LFTKAWHRLQMDGWEGYDQETSDFLPKRRGFQHAIAARASTLKVYMYKGCTRDAQGITPQSALDPQEINKEGPPVETPPHIGPPPEQAERAVPYAADLPESDATPLTVIPRQRHGDATAGTRGGLRNYLQLSHLRD
jgi:hypothetical protein